MAYSVLQHVHTVADSPLAGNGLTTAQTLTSPTTAGSLLVVQLHKGVNFTTVCLMPGWKLAISVTNGAGSQNELWYKIAKGNDASPVFVVSSASVGCHQAFAEFAGILNAELDKTGSATGTNVATLATAVGSATYADSELVVGAMGIINDSSGSVSPTASTAGGSATLGADIDGVGAIGSGSGIGARNTWATAGAAGTSPSITFNDDRSTLNHISGVVATFTSVSKTNYFIANKLRPHPFSPGTAR